MFSRKGNILHFLCKQQDFEMPQLTLQLPLLSMNFPGILSYKHCMIIPIPTLFLYLPR